MHEFNVFIWVLERIGLKEYANTWGASILGSMFVLFLITFFSLIFYLRYRKLKDLVVPSEKFSFQNIVEVFVEWLLNIMKSILGDNAHKHLKIIGALFIYIFVCNLLGFIPGLIAPTTVITTNFACAIVVFVYYNYIGIRKHGLVGYLKRFLGPIFWLAPLFLVIELVSQIARPISLSMRLFGNMVGDQLVLGIFSEMTPYIVPVFFIALGLFVSFIQAFIFAVLSTVYIALAVEDS